MEIKHRKISKYSVSFIFCLSLLIQIAYYFISDKYIAYIIIPYAIMSFGFIYLLIREKMIRNKKILMLITPIMMIMLSKLISDIAISNLILNVFILPILITVLFVLLVNPDLTTNDISILWIFRLFPYHFITNQINVFNILFKKKDHNYKLFKDIFLGLFIMIPIIFIVLILLITADSYFGSLIDKMIDLIYYFVNYDLIYRMILLIVYFVFYQSVYQNIVYDHNIKKNTTHSYYHNTTMYKTILWGLNLLYMLFLISEISKLTTNFFNLPIQYTYANYAREGFFQLLLIVGINYSLIKLFNFLDSDILNDKNNRKINLWLFINSLLLISNSFYRMILYISAYGLTILRVQVILFLIMTSLLFITMVLRMLKMSFKDRSYSFMILVVFYILNLYLASQPVIDYLNKLLFIS